ncbi:MAG: hypothetical protein ACT6SF_11415 [Hydrogenophaga sp.]
MAARHTQAGNTGKLSQRYGFDAAERLSQINYLRGEGTAGAPATPQSLTHNANGNHLMR